MAWVTQEIEKLLEKKLEDKFPLADSTANDYFGHYTSARSYLISGSIYKDITRAKKDLSDHSEDHIMEVLKRADELLGEEASSLDAIEIYFICMIILFHDVGNLIENRDHHHEQGVIREVYDFVRKKDDKRFIQERKLVPEVASKHSGKSADGTTDTIKELSLPPEFLFENKIYTRKCAALLRLADECCEGPQRTSAFMNKHYDYDYEKKSIVYHKYAEITTINIDRQNERICLTYNFVIRAVNGVIEAKEKEEFIELFGFTIKRMLKLEAERKYCRYYCDWLAPLKKTDIKFNFEIDNHIGDKVKSEIISLGELDLTLDDLELPGEDHTISFLKMKSFFTPGTVFDSIVSKFNE